MPLRWRDRTILSRQREWRDKVFHVENVIQRGTSCYANTGGATALEPTGMTKRIRCEFFFKEVIIKILNKND